MIALGVSHQISHNVLGQYVIRNVTKFQSCRNDNKSFLGEKLAKQAADMTVARH